MLARRASLWVRSFGAGNSSLLPAHPPRFTRRWWLPPPVCTLLRQTGRWVKANKGTKSVTGMAIRGARQNAQLVWDSHEARMA